MPHLARAFRMTAQEVIAPREDLDRLHGELRTALIDRGSFEKPCQAAFVAGRWEWPAYDRWVVDRGVRVPKNKHKHMGTVFAAAVSKGAMPGGRVEQIKHHADTHPFVLFSPVGDSLDYDDCTARRGEIFPVAEEAARRRML